MDCNRRFALAALCFVVRVCRGYNLVSCSTDKSCEMSMQSLEVPFYSIRCLKVDEARGPFCAEVDGQGRPTFISLKECTEDRTCQIIYPDFPICNKRSGSCEPPNKGCKYSSECKRGQTCRSGRCIQDDRQCQSHNECPYKNNKKAVCHRNVCNYLVVGCSDDRDCHDGMKCYQRRCLLIGCRSDKDCNLASSNGFFICHKQKCLQSKQCLTSNDCRRNFGFGYTCSSGRCRQI